MQSHDAEFADHGRTPPLPVNDICPTCKESIGQKESWGRDEKKWRVHFPECMPYYNGEGKPFRNQIAKDAAIANAERTLAVSTQVAKKYEEIYHAELQEKKRLIELLMRMNEAPIRG